MQAKDIIRNLMQSKKVTQVDITQKLQLKSQSAVSSALSRDMKASIMLRFLNILGCELIIRDKDTGTEYKVEE